MQITMKRQAQIERERAADLKARFAAMTERELVGAVAALTDKLGDRSIDYRVLVNVSASIAAARVELATRHGHATGAVDPDAAQR